MKWRNKEIFKITVIKKLKVIIKVFDNNNKIDLK